VNPLKSWTVCLDLTRMDDLLISYVDYLAAQFRPDEIEFLHIIDNDKLNEELITLFRELDDEEDLDVFIRNYMVDKIEDHFTNIDIPTKVLIRNGGVASQIIKRMEDRIPDMLIMGKKNSYEGDGQAARKLVKYVPSSLLLVPETARFSLDHITVPVDFSWQSAEAVKLALNLTGNNLKAVTAQYIYKYPNYLITYILDKKEQKLADELAIQARDSFFEEFKLDPKLHVELTVLREKRMSDEIHDMCLAHKSDMIIVAYKARNGFVATLKDNLPDRMVNYNFGMPVLVLKHKDRNKPLFDALVSQRETRI
jgi:nucleotide-binding universal stress UspA family protein